MSINKDEIKAKVKGKIDSGHWDKEYNGRDLEELLTQQILRYASDVRLLTNNQNGQARQINGIDIDEFIAEKLLSIDVIRFGDFKDGIDDNIVYDKYISVTSKEYRELPFGAATVPYSGKDKDGNPKPKIAVALFDNKQGYNRGIDLDNDNDIEQTLVHEFTHVLANVTEIKKDMSQEICDGETFKHSNQLGETIYADKFENSKNGRIFFNGELVEQGIRYKGISTIEEKDGKRIYHNQIDEGFTEGIARTIITSRGGEISHPDRYKYQVNLADRLFIKDLTSKDFNTDKEKAIDMFVKYISEPQTIIHEMESRSIGDNDLLHSMSDSIYSYKKIGKNFLKIIKPIKIGRFGQVMDDFLFSNEHEFENYKNDKIPNLEEYKSLIEGMTHGEKNVTSEGFLSTLLQDTASKEDFCKCFDETLELKEQIGDFAQPRSLSIQECKDTVANVDRSRTAGVIGAIVKEREGDVEKVVKENASPRNIYTLNIAKNNSHSVSR